MRTPFNLVVDGHAMPLDIYALAADGAGNVIRVDSQGPIRFRFVYRGIPIAVEIEDADGASDLRMVGDVGPMPFTSESADARVDLHAIIDAANGHLGQRFRVSEDGHILMAMRAPIEPPLNAARLVAALVRALAPVTPYLECIAVFLHPPCARKPGEGALAADWRRPVRRR